MPKRFRHKGVAAGFSLLFALSLLTVAAATPTRAAASLPIFTGRGDQTTNTFTTPAVWTVDWNYNCGSSSTPSFVVTIYVNGTPLPVGVNELAARKSGDAYVTNGAGQTYLSINSNSECAWIITLFTWVFAPASLGSHGSAYWDYGHYVTVTLKAMAPGKWKQQLWSGTCASPKARLLALPTLVVPNTRKLVAATKATVVPATGSGVVLRLLHGSTALCGAFVKPLAAPTSPEASPSASPTPSPTPTPITLTTNLLLAISGSGIQDTQYFTAPAEWEIHWSYDCSNFGSEGNFQVYVYVNGEASTSGVNELGMSGSGVEYVHDSAGQAYLSINSECEWAVTVLASSTSEATPPSGYLLDISGSGSQTTNTFSTPASWEYDWSYDCSNFGSAGNFIVSLYIDGEPIPGGVNELNVSGSGAETVTNGAGQAYLSINSECDWTVIAKSDE